MRHESNDNLKSSVQSRSRTNFRVQFDEDEPIAPPQIVANPTTYFKPPQKVTHSHQTSFRFNANHELMAFNIE